MACYDTFLLIHTSTFLILGTDVAGVYDAAKIAAIDTLYGRPTPAPVHTRLAEHLENAFERNPVPVQGQHGI